MGLDSANFFRLYKNPRSMPAIPDLPCGKTGHYKLKSLNPPIGVFFETENIYTLNPNSEMSLSFIVTLAQEESHNKSEIMNSSIEMRFKRGIFLTPVLLGYDQDENGDLIINEKEAAVVRLIFFLYLYGYSIQEIAGLLSKL